MDVDPADLKDVSRMLWPNEKVVASVRQRRIGPGGSLTVPTSVVVTDMRIIIINKATLGIRHDYEVIPYNSISSVRYEHGIISSSVFIRVQGYDTDRGLLKKGDQEGEIDGLNNRDAEALSNYINKKIAERVEPPAAMAGYEDNKVGGYIFCAKCGAKNPSTATFCSACGAQLVSEGR